MKTGLLQGSTLLPFLLNVNDIALSLKTDGSYADDIYNAASHVKPAEIAEDLLVAAAELAEQAGAKGSLSRQPSLW